MSYNFLSYKSPKFDLSLVCFCFFFSPVAMFTDSITLYQNTNHFDLVVHLTNLVQLPIICREFLSIAIKVDNCVVSHFPPPLSYLQYFIQFTTAGTIDKKMRS